MPRWRRLLAGVLGGIALAVAAAPGPSGPHPLVDAVLSTHTLDGWQDAQGLPVGAMQAVQQTRDGTLWLGTGAGLLRFDGLRFTGVDDPEVPALAKRPIFGLMEDRDGVLWIGHAGGAARWQAGQFRSVFDPKLLDGRRVWAFAQAKDGAVWAATENGLLRWTREGVRAFRVEDGLPTNRLRALAFDREGVLWIGTTGGGLVAYDGQAFKTWGAAQGVPHPEVRHVLADPDGGVWVATAGAGLVHLQGDQVRRYTTADGLPSDQLTFLARDPRGALWIGTWGAGVARWDGRQFQTLSSAQGLGGDQIWTLHADREDSLWIGSWTGGLNRLRPRSFAVLGKAEGLSGDNARAVLRARDGSLWVSSAGGGVDRIHDGHVTRWGLDSGLPTLEMSTLHEDADGSLWMGSYTAGLVRWHNGRLSRYGLADGLPHVDVRVVHRDRHGVLWVGTRAGLARREGERFVPVRDEGAPVEGVVAVAEQADGSVWFATTGDGLMRWHGGRFTRLTRQDGLVSNWIVSLHVDADDALWIGTNGEGIHRLKGGRLATLRPSDGLWDGLAQVFVEDGRGGMWITCNRGVYRVALAELNAFAEGRLARVNAVGYGPGDALRSPTFAGGLQPAGAVDAAGRLWLPSLKGLVRIDPEHLPQLPPPPVLRVEAISLAGQSLPVSADLVLPPGATPPLTLRYAAATVRHAERVRFRYRMEGMTPDWIEVGNHREATFPSLPHGQYRFRVAATLDGHTWAEAAPLSVTVQPRWYQTPWAALGAVVAAALAMAGAVQLRTRHLRQRQADMERVVAEKTEALRLANEHLEALSFSDALTGLANRRRFDEALAREWRRTARAQLPLALVLADIDSFKAYNDSVGHAAGDDCLRAVADVIRDIAGRAGDLAARYGGEEFVLLLPGLDRTAALAFAERLRAACEARALPHPASVVGPTVTLSLGVAAWVPDAANSPQSLFTAADEALYRAKAAGRNCVR